MPKCDGVVPALSVYWSEARARHADRRLGRRVGLKSPLDARGGRSCVGLSLRAPTPTQFCARGDARRKRSLRCGHITSCTYPHSGHFIEVRGLLTRNFTTQRPKTPTVWTRHKLGRGPWLVICTQESARTRIFACGRITNHTEPHARSVPAVSWRSGLEPHGGDTSDTPQRRAKNLGFDRDAENITLRSRAPCCFVVSELPRVAGRIGPSRVAPTPQDNPTTNQSETSLVSDAPWTKEAEEGPKSSSPRAIRF